MLAAEQKTDGGHRAAPRRERRAGDRFWRTAVDLVYPPQCAFCLAELSSSVGWPLLCEDCRAALVTPPEARCPRCGRRRPEELPVGESCPPCDKERWYTAGVVQLGRYDDLRPAVMRMKYRASEPLAWTMGEVMAETLHEQLARFSPQAVVPVPMHWLRRLRRGTNSAETLAGRVAARLGVPLVTRALVRRRHTRPQTDFLPTKRKVNVRGAFGVRRGYGLRGARLLLVDDVLTTGATCNYAAKALRDAGADAVFAAVLAHGDGL